jgi:sporulation protein YlmC with PRC-barrel domain
MDVSINAKVICLDGPAGHVTHVILKPTTEKITHLVIGNGLYPETRFIVPIEHVSKSSLDQIQLDCKVTDVAKMPIFDRIQFIASDLSSYQGNPYLMWPYFSPEVPYVHIEGEHIPAGELVIRRGADVEATDGRIGSVDEFLIDPQNDHITHLVMREGHLWGKKDISIPVGQIDHYRNNTVYLKLNKQAVEALPVITIHHKEL